MLILTIAPPNIPEYLLPFVNIPFFVPNLVQVQNPITPPAKLLVHGLSLTGYLTFLSPGHFQAFHSIGDEQRWRRPVTKFIKNFPNKDFFLQGKVMP